MKRMLPLLLAAWPLAAAPVVKLDFGTTKSALRPGFTRVTTAARADKSTAAGWLRGAALRAVDAPVKREWTYSESSGRSNPPPRYTSALSQDHIESRAPAVLRLPLPDGRYRLWILCGHAGGLRQQVWDVTASAGRAARTITFPGPSAIRKIELTADARGGALDVTFSTRSIWLVNALVAAPEAEWPAVRKRLLDALEFEHFVLPPDVAKKWKREPRLDDAPLPPFSKQDKQRGFAVYHRHYLDVVWPATKPRPRDLNAPVRAFAAQGEYEPLTFTLYPLRDAQDVDVVVTDLRTRSGSRLPSQCIDVRYVRYQFVRPNYRVFGVYYRAPDVLMPIRPRPLKKGENFRVWLTVHVNEFAPPGLYRGEARVRVQGRTAAVVPLTLRVLPFRLEKDRSLVFGEYYRHPYDRAASAPDAFSRSWWLRKAELEHADMAAHGMNTFTMGLWGRPRPNGRWRLNYDALAARIDLFHRYGFYQPFPLHIPTSVLYRKYMHSSMGSHLRLVKMPPPKFFDDMTELVRQIERERRLRQWPEFLYYPVDEPSTRPESVQFMAAVLKAIKRVPGARTYVTADPTHEQFAPMRPYVDVWCCQPFNPDRKTILADMKKRGVTYWCYPNHVSGENDHTPVAGARMTYGFGLWRSGFRALIPWIYQAVIGDPWNYLDGSAMDFFNRTADDGSPIPVVLWEAYREGIDDGRYITTLDRMIERAKAAGLKDAVAAAERDRQFVWDSIRVQTKYKYDDLWAPEAFDVYRWILANQILSLRDALEE